VIEVYKILYYSQRNKEVGGKEDHEAGGKEVGDKEDQEVGQKEVHQIGLHVFRLSETSG
ncbi:hypothetical protein HK102_011014, partial [Quaeritorhiza haematococci]